MTAREVGKMLAVAGDEEGEATDEDDVMSSDLSAEDGDTLLVSAMFL